MAGCLTVHAIGFGAIVAGIVFVFLLHAIRSESVGALRFQEALTLKQDASGINMSEVAHMLDQFPDQQHCVFQSGEDDAVWGPGVSERSRSLALKESNGFFEDSDDTWIRRKKRHIHQMCLQGQLMKACPEGMWSRRCIPGCAPYPAIFGCLSEHFWQAHYEPSFSCDFERRLGLQGEGGKWICDPYKVRNEVANGGKCLVYSVGSNGQYDFEAAIHNGISPHCEIHTVDKNNWSHYSPLPPPSYVHYHVHEIGLPPKATNLSAVVNELGHAGRTIDIFKIDCEGCEWETYESWFGEGVYIRQIQVELHYIHQSTHTFFNHLFDLGFVIFHKEPNTLGCRGKCLEYAFVNLSPEFSRARSV